MQDKKLQGVKIAPTERLLAHLRRRSRKQGYKDFWDYLAKVAMDSPQIALKLADKYMPNLQHSIEEHTASPEMLEAMQKALDRIETIRASRGKAVKANYTIEQGDTESVNPPGYTGDANEKEHVPE